MIALSIVLSPTATARPAALAEAEGKETKLRASLDTIGFLNHVSETTDLVRPASEQEKDPAKVAELNEIQKGLYEKGGPLDSRTEVEGAPDGPRAVAESVAALIDEGYVVLSPSRDGYDVEANVTLTETQHVCPKEPFRAQPAVASCTGFLVAGDIIATAGHCLPDAVRVAKTRFVFGYRMQAGAFTSHHSLNDVYTGTRIGPPTSEDWALVRLDRNVIGRAPLKLANRGGAKIPDRAEVYTIGTPVGVPLKYAGHSIVRDNAPATSFLANLDTFAGNSGSPVMAAASDEVEGILLKGGVDFATISYMGLVCQASLVCPSETANAAQRCVGRCVGETVLRIERLAEPLRLLRSH